MARRAKGEGTLRHRVDGRWEARIPNGNATPKIITRRTKTAVLKAVEEYKAESKQTPANDVTFGTYSKEWLESERLRVAPATYLSRANVINVHCERLADKPLREVNDNDLRVILRPLGEMNVRPVKDGKYVSVGPATREKIRSVLHLMFRTAIRKKLLESNPVELMDPERVTHVKEIRSLTKAQLARVFKAAKGNKWEPFFRLALATGARPGELCALRWSDVDFSANSVSIRASLGRESANSTRLVRKRTKTGASARTLGVEAEALDLLKYRWKALGKPTQGLIFSVKSREDAAPVPVNLRNLNRVLSAIATKAGIDSMTLYDFRHTFATLMLFAGEDLVTVAHLLGHKGTKLLMTTYAHVLDDMKKRAAKTAGNILRKALEEQEPPIIEVPVRFGTLLNKGGRLPSF
ncbi:MAG TPA: site-specific integrase [Candidatus Cybelea sp.]|jgi:integrase